MHSAFFFCLILFISVVNCENTTLPKYQQVGFKFGIGLDESKFICNNIFDNGVFVGFNAIVEPLPASNLHFCLGTNNVSLAYTLRIEIKEDSQNIVRFKTEMGFESMLLWQGNTNACGKSSCVGMTFKQNMYCLSEGMAIMKASIMFIDVGERFDYFFNASCSYGRSFRAESNLTHSSVSIPAICFFSYTLVVYLGLDFSVFTRKRKSHKIVIKLQNLLDYVGKVNAMYFILGWIVFIVAAEGAPIFSSKDSANVMHAFFGFFLIVSSILGFLLRRDMLRNRVYNFGVAMMAFGTGFLLLMHDQASMLEYFSHRGAGISLMMCGVFKIISDFKKQFTLLYILFGLLGIFLFWAGSEYFVTGAFLISMHGVNFVFLVLIITVMWMITVITAVMLIGKCKPVLINISSDNHSNYKKPEENGTDEEMVSLESTV